MQSKPHVQDTGPFASVTSQAHTESCTQTGSLSLLPVVLSLGARHKLVLAVVLALGQRQMLLHEPRECGLRVYQFKV